MLQRLRELLASLGDESPGDAPDENDLAEVTAALLLEVARADFQADPEELALVESLVRTRFALEDDALTALLDGARKRVDDSVSLHEFTRTLNECLDEPGKMRILEMLWRVAHADGRVDKHEEHLLRRVADLLHLPHSQFIRAKLRTSGA